MGELDRIRQDLTKSFVNQTETNKKSMSIMLKTHNTHAY